MKGTGILKKWAFAKIDWDQAIKDGRIEVLEMDLNLMNATELVELLRLLGLRVDRGYGLHELRGILRQLGRGERTEVSAPIDILRDRLIMIWERYKSIIRDQLPPYCEFKCYEHPDLMVLSCYLKNREKIEEELRKG